MPFFFTEPFKFPSFSHPQNERKDHWTLSIDDELTTNSTRRIYQVCTKVSLSIALKVLSATNRLRSPGRGCWSVPRKIPPWIPGLVTHSPTTPPVDRSSRPRPPSVPVQDSTDATIGAGIGRRDRGSSAGVLAKSIKLKLKVQTPA